MKELVQKKAGEALRFIDKFRAFAMRGNVIDMAVGIIIGAAFKDIVSSLVKDILMPPLGILMGGINFAQYKITLKDAIVSSSGQNIQAAVTLNIGSFLQAVFDFTIMAFALFMVIQITSRAYYSFDLAQKEEDLKEQDSQENILKDIRDILKKQSY